MFDGVIAYASGTRWAWWVRKCNCLGPTHVGTYTVQFPFEGVLVAHRWNIRATSRIGSPQVTVVWGGFVSMWAWTEMDLGVLLASFVDLSNLKCS